jgi:hypothetical protein
VVGREPVIVLPGEVVENGWLVVSVKVSVGE